MNIFEKYHPMLLIPVYSEHLTINLINGFYYFNLCSKSPPLSNNSETEKTCLKNEPNPDHLLTSFPVLNQFLPL